MEQYAGLQQAMAGGPQSPAMAAGQPISPPAGTVQPAAAGCECPETAAGGMPASPGGPSGQAGPSSQPVGGAAAGAQQAGSMTGAPTGQPMSTLTGMAQPAAAGCECPETAAGGMSASPGGPTGQAVEGAATGAGNTGQQTAMPAQQAGGMAGSGTLPPPQMGAFPGQAMPPPYPPHIAGHAGFMPGAGINPQMGGPVGQAGVMGQAYDPGQQAAWQAWYQQSMAAQQAAQAHAAAMGSTAAGPAGTAANTGPHHLKHEKHKYGQMTDMVGRFLNGDANAGDMVDGLLNLNFRDNQFWKGAVVGAVTTFLLTSETVKESLAKTAAAVFSTAQGGPEKEAAEKEKT